MKHFYLLFLCTLCSFSVLSQVPKNLESELVLLNVKTGKEKVILREKRHFEAPNWSRDGKFLIINSDGKLEKVSVKGKKLGIIDTGFADRCNNDHGLTFDGRWLIVSHNDPRVTSSGGSSRIFILPAIGGVPRLITTKIPVTGTVSVPITSGSHTAPCATDNGMYTRHTLSPVKKSN